MRKLLNKIKYFFSKEYCYDNSDKNFIRQDGSCKGKVGGDRRTEYLSECCIGCKYFSWKEDVVDESCKYDANSVEEIYEKGRQDLIKEVVAKLEEMREEARYYEENSTNIENATYQSGKKFAYDCAIEIVKEQNNDSSTVDM